MRTPLLVWLLLGAAAADADPIRLGVDLRDAARHVYHARETIPVTPGQLTLRYPKWIPGDHSPTGPISDVVGLRFTAGEETLAWARDPEDMYVLRVDVPDGVSTIEAAFDFLVATSGGAFTDVPSTSEQLAILLWNTVILYPDGVAPSELTVESAIELPDGWQAATALRPLQRRDGKLVYAPVSLETLIDSPLAAGAHYREIPLAAPAGAPEHLLHLFADGEAALEAKPDIRAAWDRLVGEAHALFGAHHYRRYDFLVALSDHVAHYGLEHHESSENRMPERALRDDEPSLAWASLLAHELVHSWNGKYRRPSGLATGDYQRPMVGDLLWVYEGLTEYWGEVLTARSGLRSVEDELDALAYVVATLAQTKGREWRPLADTARAAQLVYTARGEGTAWRRSTDFYGEGLLVWLEVDALIRTRTGGAKSLDDFARAFFGPPDTPPQTRPYTRPELVDALQAISPFDWEAFFVERIDRLRSGPPLEGIEAAGWKLVYTEEPNALMAAIAAEEDAGLDLRFSLGLRLTKDATVEDVVPGSAAAESGVPVGAEIVAVNARAFSPEVLADALAAAKQGHKPIELLIRSRDHFSTSKVEYQDGERHPHLVRDASRPDLLTAILAPRAVQSE